MKKIFPAFALWCSFVFVAASPAAAGEDDDCSKSADACKPSAKTVSPFMTEVKKAEEALETKQGRPRQAELKPAAVEAASAPAAGAPPAAGGEKKDALSKPAWLLAMFALLAGLYYFLKEGKRRGKRS
ncbi:MAG: hypothetical protein KKH28_11350 [Elusimicrobia bacterium]|nr:hypothetical protein [Elusimicrobiota bacterium]